jgi:hypothetical protein
MFTGLSIPEKEILNFFFLLLNTKTCKEISLDESSEHWSCWVLWAANQFLMRAAVWQVCALPVN